MGSHDRSLSGPREVAEAAGRRTPRTAELACAPEAAVATVAAIRHVAREHGAEDKYHETITRAWLHCVAVHNQRWAADSFAQFLERNPDLLERTLLEHFYPRGRILSGSARASWVAPDLRGLPALVEQM